ncbi:hypothetical protein AURDEDRAFT_124793 [Auricularia subglabra TFB-10046 SS5]|nr:hypothetical protein AURDEDRAFT_124793 [Auricularia subglabra TFB-10046 SS5]
MRKSHVSSACAECRRKYVRGPVPANRDQRAPMFFRKVKCDGRRPVCSSCAGTDARPNRECVFAPEKDGRTASGRRANCADCKAMEGENVRLENENRQLSAENGQLKDENGRGSRRRLRHVAAASPLVTCPLTRSATLQLANGDGQGDSPPKTPQTALFGPDGREGVGFAADGAPAFSNLEEQYLDYSAAQSASYFHTHLPLGQETHLPQAVYYGTIYPDDEPWTATGDDFPLSY